MGAELLGIDVIWLMLAGAVIFFVGLLEVVKKKDMAMGIGAVLVIIGLVLYIAPMTEVVEEEEDEIEGCLSTTTPSITPICIQKHAPGTSLAGQDLLYRVAGAKGWSSGTCGTAITAFSPYDDVEFIICNQTSTTETDGDYYTLKTSYSVPCKETDSFTIEVAQEAAVANIGVAWKNDNDAVSTAMVLGAGDVKTGYIKFTGQYQRDLGNVQVGKNSNVLTCMYNATEIDKIILGSPEFQTTSKPNLFISDTNSENTTISWFIPVLESNENTGWIPFTIDADNTENPGSSSSTNIKCTLFDSNYYLHGISGEFDSGVMDEDNNDIGQASTTTPELIFTYS